MKKKPLKRKSKSLIRKTQDELWQLCRTLTFSKYGNTCWTCGAKGLEKNNLQCGHMWAKASLGAYLKYDLRVLRPQCMRCNQFMGGMGADFYKKTLAEIGEEQMKILEEDRLKSVKAIDHYIFLIDKYKTMI